MRGFGPIEYVQNRLQNPIDIFANVIVPESQHQITHRLQSPRPIRFIGCSMLPAVYFNDEMSIDAEEINNISIDGHLSLNFKPVSLRSRRRSHKIRSASVWFLRNRLAVKILPLAFMQLLLLPNPLTPSLSPPGRGSHLLHGPALLLLSACCSCCQFSHWPHATALFVSCAALGRRPSRWQIA